jgi:hypothetical protein
MDQKRVKIMAKAKAKKHTNGGDKLNRTQLKRFNKLQDAFFALELWVGWADNDPETADQLTITDDESGDEYGYMCADLLAFVIDGDGNPSDLAQQYADEMRVAT